MEEGNLKGDELKEKQDQQVEPPQVPKLCWTKNKFKYNKTLDILSEKETLTNINTYLNLY